MEAILGMPGYGVKFVAATMFGVAVVLEASRIVIAIVTVLVVGLGITAVGSLG